jgi:dihydrofolate reductase
MSVRVFIACSLDGFIAGPDDDLSWLPDDPPEGVDWGYDAFMAGTDALLMGRGTWDVVAGFDTWPYGETPVFVATTRPLQTERTNVHAVSGTPAELLDTVRDAVGDGGIYLDGGVLIRAFLDAGLVDELTVSIVPVVLGAGHPLFAGATRRHAFDVEEAVDRAGLVQLRLKPTRSS